MPVLPTLNIVFLPGPSIAVVPQEKQPLTTMSLVVSAMTEGIFNGPNPEVQSISSSCLVVNVGC